VVIIRWTSTNCFVL